jgi:hypothetical protein
MMPNTISDTVPELPIQAIGSGATDAHDTTNLAAKYQVDQLMYPLDLFSPETNSNYVIITINVPADSKMFQDPDSNQLVVQNADRRQLDTLRGKNLDGSIFFGTEAISALGAASVETLINLFHLKPSLILKDAAAIGIGGGTSGFLTSQVYRYTQGFSRPTKQLKSAIALHVPNNLQANYSVSYQETELGLLGDIAAIAASNPEIASKLKSTAGSFISSLPGIWNDKTASSQAGSGIQGIIAKTAISSSLNPTSEALSFFSGLAANPRLEQIFRRVNFRQFQFFYQFAPRNAQEAANVLNIIYTLKRFMHPEFKDISNFLYIYPAEFDITYYIGSQENPNLHAHTSCVLTDLNVNYTPNGSFQTFQTGQPVQIDVTMNFLELTPLTKDIIEDLENPSRTNLNTFNKAQP